MTQQEWALNYVVWCVCVCVFVACFFAGGGGLVDGPAQRAWQRVFGVIPGLLSRSRIQSLVSEGSLVSELASLVLSWILCVREVGWVSGKHEVLW